MKNLIITIKNIKDSILSSKDSRKIIENSSWQVLNSIFNLIIGVFVVAIVARYFGPDKYGELNYAVAFVSLFSAVANLGLETLTIKNIVDESWDEGTILCTSFIMRVVGGFLLTITAYLTIKIISPNDTNIHILIFIMSLTIILKSFEIIEYWIQAYQMTKISSVIRISSYLIFSLLKILLVFLNRNILEYASLYVLYSAILGIALSIAYIKVREKISPWKFSFKYAKYILSQSWYLILSGMMVSLYNRVDQIMLGTMLTNKAETGIYSAAVNVAELWYFVPMSIINSFKPVVMSRKNGNPDSYNNTVQSMYSLITMISIGFCIMITIFSRLIISILYGAEFIKSASVLVILVWAGTFAMLGSSRSVWLISEGLQKYSMFYTFAGCIINIPLNYIFIPVYGAYGAAMATLLAQFLNIVALSVFKDTRKSTNMIIKSFSPAFMIKSIKQFLEKE